MIALNESYGIDIYKRRTNVFSNILKLLFFVSLLLFVHPYEVSAQRRASRAVRISESVPHNNRPVRRYTPPRSESVAPGRRAAPPRRTTSFIPFIMNEPRDPLRPSDRDRFYGIGVMELGLSTGLSHVFTDMHGKLGQGSLDLGVMLKDFTSYQLGVFARYRVNEWVGFSFGLDHAKLQGLAPDGFTYVYGTQMGMPVSIDVYSFSNRVYEMSGKMELHAPPLGRAALGLYGFLGLSGVYSQPLLFDSENQQLAVPPDPATGRLQQELSPLGLALPFGAGVTAVVGNYVRVGLELGYRYTANHGLDGIVVPTSGYDSFMFSTLRVGYILPSRK